MVYVCALSHWIVCRKTSQAAAHTCGFNNFPRYNFIRHCALLSLGLMIQDKVVGPWERALSGVHAFPIAAFRLAWELIVDGDVAQDPILDPCVEIRLTRFRVGARRMSLCSLM